MRTKLLTMLVLSTIALGAACVANALATPGSGFAATTLALGRFGEIDATNHVFLPGAAAPAGRGHHRPNLWLSLQKTKGDSDVYVQSNVWEPGGTTGWHTHPGHSLIIVTAGTVTVYEGDDRRCKPHVYSVGMGFVDEGGDHVHVMRNEDGIEARTVAVQLVPAGATRRFDAPANPACPF